MPFGSHGLISVVGNCPSHRDIASDNSVLESQHQLINNAIQYNLASTGYVVGYLVWH
jgi:hypothetical protein